MRNACFCRAAIAGLVMVVGLAACGAAPAADDGVASLGDSATTATVAEDPEAPTDPDAARALFDSCMAEHGVELPEAPAGGDDGDLMVRSQSGSSGEPNVVVNGVEMDPEAFHAAEEACRHHLANLDHGFELTPEQEAAMEDANLAFQECMNEHGIEGDFNVAVGGGGGLSGGGSQPGPDPQASPDGGGDIVDDEALQAAHEECMKVFEEVPELEPLFEEAPELEGSLGGPGH